MDLMVRTSGECRLSDFLLVQAAAAHLHFAAALWPDFSYLDMLAALAEYQRAAPGLARIRAACKAEVSAAELAGEASEWGEGHSCGMREGCRCQAAAARSIPCACNRAGKPSSCADRGIHYDLIAAADGAHSALLENARDRGWQPGDSCSPASQQLPAQRQPSSNGVCTESAEVALRGCSQCQVDIAASRQRIQRFLRTRTNAPYSRHDART